MLRAAQDQGIKMLHSRNAVYVAVALAVGAVLTGCSSSNDGPSLPPPPSSNFTALFSPSKVATGVNINVPYPYDAFFAGSKDLTLEVPAGFINPEYLRTAVNALDGFSTTAEIRTRFNAAIDSSTLTAANVKVVEMWLDNLTKLPAGATALPPGVASPVRRVLRPGDDYVADIGPEVDSGATYLRIRPTKALEPSTGAFNTGYYVILTNGIKDQTGRSATADLDYATFKNANATCSDVDASLRGPCAWTKAHLQIAQATGTDPATVIMSWQFTTQSTDDSFVILDKLVGAQPILVQKTPLTTAAIPGGKGLGDIYAGALSIPWYMNVVPANANDRAILTSSWVAAGPPAVPGLDPTSRNITRFNPVPAKKADLQIPLLVTAPNAKANNGAGCVKPATGWPVMIYQHGITRSRLDGFAVADGLNNACFVMAAIDLPMHGVTDTTSPLYQKGRERTFDLDLVNNTTGASTPDGRIDSSGTHAVSVLLSSPLTGRDLSRQGPVDIGVLAKSLANLDLTGDGASDIDKNRIHFTGMSLGAMGGVTATHFTGAFRTSTLAAGGGTATTILRDSPSFAPTVSATLNAGGLAPGSTVYSFFFRDVQTVFDSADPINHIFDAQVSRPVHVIKVLGDTTVQDAAQEWLVRAGRLKRLGTPGTYPVGPGSGVFVEFVPPASHGSLIDPTTSAAATTEMQTQAIRFAASAAAPGGPFLTITNGAVVKP
jgi:hypothetical protein